MGDEREGVKFSLPNATVDTTVKRASHVALDPYDYVNPTKRVSTGSRLPNIISKPIRYKVLRRSITLASTPAPELPKKNIVPIPNKEGNVELPEATNDNIAWYPNERLGTRNGLRPRGSVTTRSSAWKHSEEVEDEGDIPSIPSTTSVLQVSSINIDKTRYLSTPCQSSLFDKESQTRFWLTPSIIERYCLRFKTKSLQRSVVGADSNDSSTPQNLDGANTHAEPETRSQEDVNVQAERMAKRMNPSLLKFQAEEFDLFFAQKRTEWKNSNFSKIFSSYYESLRVSNQHQAEGTRKRSRVTPMLRSKRRKLEQVQPVVIPRVSNMDDDHEEFELFGTTKPTAEHSVGKKSNDNNSNPIPNKPIHTSPPPETRTPAVKPLEIRKMGEICTLADYSGGDTTRIFQSLTQECRTTMAHFGPLAMVRAKTHDNIHTVTSAAPITLEYNHPLPRYTAYVPLKQNIVVPDERRLQFLPWFGDNERNDLNLELYEWEDDSEVDTVFAENAILHLVDVFGESDLVFSGLSLVLGKQVARIKERYEDLVKLLKSMANMQDSLIHTDGKNILEANGIESKCLDIEHLKPQPSDNVDEYLLANRQYFCRRCYIYNCETHGLNHPQPVGTRMRTIPVLEKLQKFVTTVAYPKLLRFHCYSSPAIYLQYATSSWAKNNKLFRYGDDCFAVSKKTDSDKEVDSWSTLELSVLHAAYYVCAPNFCIMSALIGTKTCREVYQYCQLALFPTDFSNDRVYDIVDLYGTEFGLESQKCKMKRKNGSLKTFKKNLRQLNDILSHSFKACHHAGECTPKVCPCARNNMECEKYCACEVDCRIRFRGCGCRKRTATSNNSVTSTSTSSGPGPCGTRACICFSLGRECDPDMCHTCGADCQVTLIPSSSRPDHPVEDANDTESICTNMDLQCGSNKFLRLGRSRIHGWGAYSTNRIKKFDFISEYCGETISQNEAERRGNFYDILNRSYLFQLNKTAVCDAARKGNKIKFANHSNKPNSVSRVKFVNGDHRIGIYALQDVEKGEEITFDYNHFHDGTNIAGGTPEWYLQQIEKQFSDADQISRTATKQAY